jgi:hypothetical protein
MITRITRGTLQRDSEARVFGVLRQAFEDAPSPPPGLLSFGLHRRLKGPSAVELVAITVWEDLEAMATAMGPGWREPAFLPGLADSISDTSLEILEGIILGYENLPRLAIPNGA